MDDFFDRTAAVGSDEEEEFDEETGEALGRPRKSKTNGNVDDSSEEEDDDDEEAERAVAEGFIDDEEEDPEVRKERRRERKKRRREEREEDEGLDEEDLDLIGLSAPGAGREQQSKYKRLKRGHREDRSQSVQRGVEDIFSDEEEGADGVGAARSRGAFGYGDDMDDFIEQDEFPDEEGGQLDDDLGIRAPKKGGIDMQNLRNSGLDEADIEDMNKAFGEGDEFAWALEQEKMMEAQLDDPDKPLELKDVFEPSQLKERMLTDEDNAIRMNDAPERFQLARKPYQSYHELTEEAKDAQNAEEPNWVANMLFPKKGMALRLREPFEKAVGTVLKFMNADDYEPAFIFQNRKDYLIHSEEVPVSPDLDRPDAPDIGTKAEKMLNQSDLWEVFEQDLKYRAFKERRAAVQKNVETLKEVDPDFNDAVFDHLLPSAVTMDEVQDLQDYVNFQYSAQLADVSTATAEANGAQKRARGARSVWEKVRSGPAYHLVRAFGITADQLAQNASKSGSRTYTDDADMRPDDLADTLVRDPDYRTGEDVLTAAKAMYIEEIASSPRMRRLVRQLYYEHLVFDVHRTDKGLKQIDEEHPYSGIKYLRNQKVVDFVDRPEMFLRMLKAESEGLIEIQVRLQGERGIKSDFQKAIISDNMSEVADAWNVFRKEVLDVAMDKLHRIISKGVKDNLKNECENKIAGYCRDAYSQKLDAAPFKPKGMSLGTTARVLALTNGEGKREDAICWAYMDENGRVSENGKFTNVKPGNPERHQEDGPDIKTFVEIVERRKPDVVAVSGWSVEARRLLEDLRKIVENFRLQGTPAEDDDGNDITDELEVVMANDEVARLYYNSARAHADHPGMPPLTRYAIALARYMQDPMKEYAALGKDVVSLSFDPSQNLIPEEKLSKWLDTAMVDMVNLCGVDLERAVSDPYTANLLPYVAGLGPRKAAHMIKVINSSSSDFVAREDLVGDIESGKRQAVGPKVFTNCASFLYFEYDETEPRSDYLDNTRIHPEDYDIARKMAADAQEMDEEDIKVEMDENGPMAVVRRLIKDHDTREKVNDLMLEQYAEQLENQFHQKKRATLETIRAELLEGYEELRRLFETPSTDEIFTMLTGETRFSLAEGMIVPVSVKRTSASHMDVKLDCGIDGGISETEYPEDVTNNKLDPRSVWTPHQTIQAKITFLNKKALTAQLTLRDEQLRTPFVRKIDRGMDEWDDELEARDKKEAKKALEASGATRAQRVIKHPLFRPFNSRDAEAFLQPQGRGDCVIRPSSKGPDHLAVTWKVHENLYQHLDVLELDKENEFSVGRTLRVGGKYSYSDLDELIVLHVRAMAKKVDEMMGDERYQNGSKTQTEQWLTTYTEANPKRSMYAFCLNAQYPGYFFLCFKAGQNAPLAHWPVKVIPNAFELRGHKYPDMRALKNGFKVLFANSGAGGGGHAGNGIPRR